MSELDLISGVPKIAFDKDVRYILTKQSTFR